VAARGGRVALQENAVTLDQVWTNHGWFIGALIVVATSASRFNTPPNSRSSTTWMRYHVVALIYVLALLATWIVLANAPEIVDALAANTELAKSVKSLEAPVYAAVLLSVLPGLSGVGEFDLKMRGFLQRLARIPWEAQRMSEALRARTWLPSPALQGEIGRRLFDGGFGENAMDFSNERTPQALWTRITGLQRYIESWKRRPNRFAGFYFANRDAVGTFEAEYDRLEPKARRVFSLLVPSGAHSDSSLTPLQSELAGAFMAAAEGLEKDLCDLVSHGILTCCVTEGARRAEFDTIGFTVNVTPSRLFDNVLGLYLLLMFYYVGQLTLLGRPNPLLLGLVISTAYLGAVMVAILLKSMSWAEGRPIARYASSGFAAFGLASLTSFAFGLLTTFNIWMAAHLLVSRSWPWGITSGVLASVVAYLIDQDEWPVPRRWEAAIVAVACALCTIPVVYLLKRACDVPGCAPPLWRVMANAAFSGTLIGAFVPTWFRVPEVMVREYRRHRISISARNVQEQVVAEIEIFAPRGPAKSPPAPERLEPVVEDTSYDALAEAIRAARAWIDGEPKRAAPAGLRLASTAHVDSTHDQPDDAVA
jgi:hypothetical protein